MTLPDMAEMADDFLFSLFLLTEKEYSERDHGHAGTDLARQGQRIECAYCRVDWRGAEGVCEARAHDPGPKRDKAVDCFPSASDAPDRETPACGCVCKDWLERISGIEPEWKDRELRAQWEET
jgi:hypothetical protein